MDGASITHRRKEKCIQNFIW